MVHNLTILFRRSLYPFYLVQGDLVCFQRDGIESVPSCFGDGSTDSDYCVDRSKFQTELWIRGDELPPGSYGLCEGEINVLLDGGYFHIL